MRNELVVGDCREVMAALDAESVDAIVCDPPYELGFMGKRWDNSGIAYNAGMWSQALRVLKPGGYLLAFGGTRTYHRLAVAVEDAGFEIRDCIAWMYGSGFPKSLDVSKAIDKRGGAPSLTATISAAIKTAREQRGMSAAECDRIFCDGTTNWSWFEGRPSGQRAPTPDTFARIVAAWPELASLADAVAEVEREVVGRSENGIAGGTGRHAGEDDAYGFRRAFDITAPATDLAQRWQGFGTALKPAFEPIVVARKPLIGTVAANVERYGCGALNIDGCRIATGDSLSFGSREIGDGVKYGRMPKERQTPGEQSPLGRWPANVVLDEDAAAMLDAQSGERKSGAAVRGTEPSAPTKNAYGEYTRTAFAPHIDTGGPSRFYYTAKASRAERNAGLDGMPERAELIGAAGHKTNPMTGREVVDVPRANHHPTVKPLSLMRWLVRLVTPPGGLILDPFLGSGSTGCAAMYEGFDFLGCDLDAEYVEIARRRIAHHAKLADEARDKQSPQLALFDGEAA